jgi:hypothetical protein
MASRHISAAVRRGKLWTLHPRAARLPAAPRYTAPMRSLLPLLLLLPLLACGESDVLRLSSAEGPRHFLGPTVRIDVDAEPVRLTVCGNDDPLPGAVDDEVSLCAVVQLDGALLAALAPGERLGIEGSAVAPAQLVTGRVPFVAGEGHAPAVLAAWVSTGCFAPPRTGGVTQQLRGTLVLEEHSAQRWRGRLELHMTGEAGGGECVVGVQGADVEVGFDVRP